MNKTPEEIKKGLEHCIFGPCGRECPYFTEIDLPFGHEQGCDDSLLPDTLAYIIDLESNDSQVKKALSDNGFASLEAFLQAHNQVKKERDAAISVICRECETCKHYEACHSPVFCDECEYEGGDRYVCCTCEDLGNWQWRGVQEGGKIG